MRISDFGSRIASRKRGLARRRNLGRLLVVRYDEVISLTKSNCKRMQAFCKAVLFAGCNRESVASRRNRRIRTECSEFNTPGLEVSR